MQTPVIPSKRFLRSEGPGRAARNVAFFATPQSRVRLASLFTLPDLSVPPGAPAA